MSASDALGCRFESYQGHHNYECLILESGDAMSKLIKLITGSNKYFSKELKENLELESNNVKFLEILKRNDISSVNFTSLGNSISTGYSINSIIKPLLKRNESLEGLLNKNNIQLSNYLFARPQDNNDEHILEWFLKNIKHKKIFIMIVINLNPQEKI